MVVIEYPRDDVTTVFVGRTPYEIEDGRVELPSMAEVRTIARRHGLHPAELSTEHCDEVVASGPRAGEVCGREKKCQFHGEDD